MRMVEDAERVDREEEARIKSEVIEALVSVQCLNERFRSESKDSDETES